MSFKEIAASSSFCMQAAAAEIAPLQSITFPKFLLMIWQIAFQSLFCTWNECAKLAVLGCKDAQILGSLSTGLDMPAGLRPYTIL